MRFGRLDADLRDLLTGLVETLPLVQERCDAEHLQRLAAARALAARLRPEHRALVPVPARTVLSEVSVETAFRFTGRAELGVELMPFAFRRRYAGSGFAASRLSLTVRQVPVPAPSLDEED